MPYETDQRLKVYLDANQLGREQLCAAVLALDKRFSDVTPRQPRGGPDAGRDLEAKFKRDQTAYAAIGFVNQACDSTSQRSAVRRKFLADLESARAAVPKADVFVFMTNVNLTIAGRSALVSSARNSGFSHCEVIDRERMRIALDSADGFAARFQYLDIPLSHSEQATFFARWGDDIQSVISTGFLSIQQTLDHLLFLQEAQSAMEQLVVTLELDREYSGAEIGHYRAFCSLYLKEPKLGVLALLFGSADKAYRFSNEPGRLPDRAGVEFGVGGVQWIRPYPRPDTPESELDGYVDKLEKRSISHAIGRPSLASVSLVYNTDTFLRLDPTLSLRDIDECMFLLILNEGLARRVKSLHVMANGYKLLEVRSGDLVIDTSLFDPQVPDIFTSDEKADPWVRLRPPIASFLRVSFAETVPVRMFASKKASRTPRPRPAEQTDGSEFQ